MTRTGRPVRFLLVFLLLNAIIVLTALPAAAAGSSLDQQQTTYGGQYALAVPRVQTFTAGVGGSLDRVDLMMRCWSGYCSGPIIVEVRAVCDGRPDDTVLTRATTDLSAWQDSVGYGSWKSVRFSAPVRVEAGKQYGLFVYGSGARGGFGVLAGGDLYPAGKLYSWIRDFFTHTYDWKADYGGTVDMAFKTYVGPPSAADVMPPSATCGPSDTVAPVVTATPTPAPNARGWNNTEVTVVLQATDNDGGSGVKELTYGADGAGAVAATTVAGASASLAITAQGTTTVSYFATDNAGNAGTASILTVNIDREAPVVAYTGNAGTYTVDQDIDISCVATDTLSGVASHTCRDIRGPAYTFNPGIHSFDATAIDNADNVGSSSVTFQVIVTVDGLRNLTKRFVTKPGVAHALGATLSALESGNARAGAGAVKAYTNAVSAQSGKTLTQEQADILIRLAGHL